MSKKIRFLVLLTLIVLFFSIIFIKTATSNINVKIQNENLSINLLNVSRINLESEKTSDFFGQKDIIYSYSLFKNFRKIGYIELTKRAIDNGDYFNFRKDNIKKSYRKNTRIFKMDINYFNCYC
ncbi:MAG: hypothetical protein PHD05_09650 [Sphaerochaetaceae bacterium]|nr:hypothetical protein [Sphaerochaetaceae bacterium]